jgi:adenylate kinase
MQKLVIMGVQGCGKGTQAKLLAGEYGLCHISVGQVLRAHIENETRLGQTVQELVEGGHLVPDGIVNQVVKTRLSEADCESGFILDGFPRNKHQAEFLLENFFIDTVIYIHVPDEKVMDRMLARRLCPACDRDYNLIYHPPEHEGVCDECGGFLIAREDDNEEAIAARLADYHAQTEPVLAVLKAQVPVVSVDGTGSIDEVQGEIRAKLGLVVG